MVVDRTVFSRPGYYRFKLQVLISKEPLTAQAKRQYCQLSLYYTRCLDSKIAYYFELLLCAFLLESCLILSCLSIVCTVCFSFCLLKSQIASTCRRPALIYSACTKVHDAIVLQLLFYYKIPAIICFKSGVHSSWGARECSRIPYFSFPSGLSLILSDFKNGFNNIASLDLSTNSGVKTRC